MLTPQYEVVRVRQSDIDEGEERSASYLYAVKTEPAAQTTTSGYVQKSQQEPAIKHIPIEEIPAPQATASANDSGQPGLLKKIYNFIFEKKEQTAESSAAPAPAAPVRQHTGHHTRPPRRRGGRFNQGRNRGRGRDRDHTGQRNEARADNRERNPNRPHRSGKPHHEHHERREHKEHREHKNIPENRQQHTPLAHHEEQAARPQPVMNEVVEIKQQLPRVIEQPSLPVDISEKQQTAVQPAEQHQAAGSDISQNAADMPQQNQNRRQRHYHARRHRNRHRTGNRSQNGQRTGRSSAGEDTLSPQKNGDES
jgi:ribonuclease E